jgi:hypothetical protein
MRAPCLLLLGFSIALPSLAGTAYIPFVAENLPGAEPNRSTAVNLEIYNQGTVSRRYAVSFVRAGEDGSRGGTFLRTDAQAPGTARTLACCDGASGLLIISGEALPAGSHASLQSLVGTLSGFTTSSLGILNLGHHPAHCLVTGFDFPERFPDLPSIDVPPISVAALPDLIGQSIFGKSARTPISFYQARPTITCDQPFYPFAITYAGTPTDPGGLPWMELVRPTVPLGSVP